MDDPADAGASGPFEARYLAFLETIAHLRPSLHRYCSRMTGSVLDGEDVVQEALFQAYRKLDTFDDERPLAPWLFRIAHNRCIDFLRRRGVREEAETAAMEPDVVLPADPAGPDLGRAVEHLVLDAAAEGTRLRAAEGRLRLLARGDRRARRLDGRRREGGAQSRPAEAGAAARGPAPPGAASERHVADCSTSTSSDSIAATGTGCAS